MMGMKTLDEFNEERKNQIRDYLEPSPNNILCGCGKGLMDTEPLVTLTSNPPLKRVHCPACGFRGHRLA